MERHYLEFMPLMSLLQGAASRLFGLGVFQMRVVPVALGMLTLILTYAVARKLSTAASQGFSPSCYSCSGHGGR